MINNIETFEDLVKEIEKLLNTKLEFVTNSWGTKTFHLVLNYKEYLIEKPEGSSECYLVFIEFSRQPRLSSKGFNNLFFVIKGLWEATDDNK